MLTKGDVVELGIRDQILSGILWCFAVQHVVDVRMVLAQCILHFGQRIGEKNLVEILVDRFGGKKLLLEGGKSGVAILSQAILVGLGFLDGHAHQGPGDLGQVTSKAAHPLQIGKLWIDVALQLHGLCDFFP